MKKNIQSNSEFFSSVLNSLPFPFLVIDMDYNICMANDTARETHKTRGSVDELNAKCYQVTHHREKPCDSEKHPCPLKQLKEIKEPAVVEHIHYDRQDKERIVQVRAIPVFDDEKNLLYMIEMCLDITQRRQMAKDLALERERLSITLNSIGDGVIATDTLGRITMMNPVAERITGWQVENAVGEQFRDVFRIINEKTREPSKDPVKHVLKEGKVVGLANHTLLLARDDTESSIADSAAPIRDNDGAMHGVVVVFRDVTEERQREMKLQHLSFHDELTGLHNRAYAERRMNELESEQNPPLSIIMMDINGLKFVNDSLGHSQGDELLKEAAQTIRETCRQKDIVSRWGGDEFLIILPGISENQATNIRQRIEKAADGKQIGDTGLPLSMALGHGTKMSNKKSIQDTIKEAESRMYRKKLSISSSVRGGILAALMRTLETKSHETQEHVERMEDNGLKIAEAIVLPVYKREELKLVIALHDIGKINIPEDILVKPSDLNEQEWATIKTHPEIGYRIASRTDDFAHVADGILHHHERWDGSGYPDGLEGEEIPLISRITAIADAYDAMISSRPYSEPRSKQEAIKELKINAGTQFDPDLVEVFVNIMSKEKK